MKSNTLRRARTVAAAAAIAIGLTATTAAAATPQAATGHLAPNVNGCGIQVQDPHNSTHVPGSINVVATVNCSVAVSHIALFVTLYKDNAYAGSGANDVYFTGSDSANAATGCQLWHYYAASAQAEIWFPSGSPQWTNVVNSPTFWWTNCTGGGA